MSKGIYDHDRVGSGDHSDHEIAIRPGTSAFGQRARERGGKSAEEIYKSRQTVGKRVKQKTTEINTILEGD